MRQIKFRGLCDNGIMRYGRLSQDKENSTMYYETHSQRICWDCSNIPVSNISLGQFTGIADKNDVMVWENDIVKIKLPINNFWSKSGKEKIGKVAYNEDRCGYIVEWEYSKNQHHIDMDCNLDIEVIGNIHENSALLTQ